MKLLIRADANNFIATGHVMRCISIAQAAIQDGHEVKFVVADMNAEVLLKKYDMKFICLDTTWDNMNQEIERIQEVIETEIPDCIVVDSYYVTEEYLSKLREFTMVVYIDDLDKFIYPCDILISYANYYKKFYYEERYPSSTKLLLGPKYAPLRRSFSNIKSSRNKSDRKNILIMSGGTDEYHVIAGFLDEYTNNKVIFGDVSITAICGVYNKDYAHLRDKYSGYENINILRAVDNIEEYMLSADIAVSAGGSTLYELCACGTPTICYAFADNQLDNVNSFAEDGVMIYAGDVRYKRIIDSIVSTIYCLLDNQNIRKSFECKMKKKVDGKGAIRIIDNIVDYLQKNKSMEDRDDKEAFKKLSDL